MTESVQVRREEGELVLHLTCCCAGSSQPHADFLVAVCRLLVAVAFLLWKMASRALGLQWLRLAGSTAQAQKLWRVGLVAPWSVGSSWIRD